MWATLDIKYGILFPVRVWIESSSAKSMLGRQDKSGSRLAAGLALQLKKYLHLFGRLWNIGYDTTFSTCVPKVWELGAHTLLMHCLHYAHGRGFCCSALVGDQVWGHQNWSAATMCWGSRSPAGGSRLEFWQALSEVEEAKFCSASDLGHMPPCPPAGQRVQLDFCSPLSSEGLGRLWHVHPLEVDLPNQFNFCKESVTVCIRQ